MRATMLTDVWLSAIQFGFRILYEIAKNRMKRKRNEEKSSICACNIVRRYARITIFSSQQN